MTETPSENRRQFYRITDEIALEYRLMTADQRPVAEYFAASDVDGIRNELIRLSHEPRPQLRQTSDRDPAILSFLRSLDLRVELLTRLVCSLVPTDVGLIRRVNLSEGGLAFACESRLPPGTNLALRFSLPSSGAVLMVRGMVRQAPEGDTDSALLHVEFEGLTELDRSILARHIMRRQAGERRQG